MSKYHFYFHSSMASKKTDWIIISEQPRIPNKYTNGIFLLCSDEYKGRDYLCDRVGQVSATQSIFHYEKVNLPARGLEWVLRLLEANHEDFEHIKPYIKDYLEQEVFKC